MNTIVKEEWYENLIEECRAIIVESIFSSRWSLIEGYWNLGKRIAEENKNFEKYKLYGQKIVNSCAESLNKSPRVVWYAIQFYKKYPKLDELPEGKNISWSKLRTLYLPEPKENKIELELPKGEYGLIVIDPPWEYKTDYNDQSRRVASPYQELSQDELKKLKIPSAKNCVLWLWTTHKFLWDAKELLDLWGFEYKLTLVWNKEKLGMGAWLRCQTEFCLLGIKGNPEWNLTNERDILTEARREHSRKPETFYKMIKKLTPTKGLDIFGREKRDGFDIYGNDPEKF